MLAQFSTAEASKWNLDDEKEQDIIIILDSYRKN